MCIEQTRTIIPGRELVEIEANLDGRDSYYLIPPASEEMPLQAVTYNLIAWLRIE